MLPSEVRGGGPSIPPLPGDCLQAPAHFFQFAAELAHLVPQLVDGTLGLLALNLPVHFRLDPLGLAMKLVGQLVQPGRVQLVGGLMHLADRLPE